MLLYQSQWICHFPPEVSRMCNCLEYPVQNLADVISILRTQQANQNHRFVNVNIMCRSLQTCSSSWESNTASLSWWDGLPPSIPSTLSISCAGLKLWLNASFSSSLTWSASKAMSYTDFLWVHTHVQDSRTLSQKQKEMPSQMTKNPASYAFRESYEGSWEYCTKLEDKTISRRSQSSRGTAKTKCKLSEADMSWRGGSSCTKDELCHALDIPVVVLMP